MTAKTGTHRSALLGQDWRYVEKTVLDDFNADDWTLLNGQRADYMAAQQARQALDLLNASRGAPSFGYMINNYRHCLQAATMAWRDGLDEETVVVALFHDLGFVVCPDSHGDFAAAMLSSFISDANHWMLRRHAIFQQAHISGYPGLDQDARERWRGHQHFAWTADFVARYDQNAMDPTYDNAPLEVFEPMVQRLFARTPKVRLPD